MRGGQSGRVIDRARGMQRDGSTCGAATASAVARNRVVMRTVMVMCVAIGGGGRRLFKKQTGVGGHDRRLRVDVIRVCAGNCPAAVKGERSRERRE